jgi:hypothetical protein
MGCEYCKNQTTVRKHGILSIICSLPHLMSLLLSNTLPHPPPSLAPLCTPARICKRKWANKNVNSHERSEELKAIYAYLVCYHFCE